MNYPILKSGWLSGKKSFTISSPFGYRARFKRMHNGIDISVPENTAISAPLAGTAYYLFNKSGYGLYVKLVSGNITLIFAHLHTTEMRVGSSKSVKEGEKIGTTGGRVGDPNAGRSSGPHLHFEYQYNGKAIDPKFVVSEAMIGKVKKNTIKTETILTEDNQTIELTDAELRMSEEEEIESYIDESETENYDVITYEVEEGLAGGIWQIIKLAMDSNVANLRLHDTSISVQTGSLQTFFQKVCQQPMVEFSGDTYGDQYYFLIRKPPFDGETMRKTLEELDLLGEEVDKNNPYYIRPIDILNANISFGGNPIYSWYQFYPIYEMGSPNDLQYIIPAVFFPEFATLWGSRDLTVRSQYRTFVSTDIYDKDNKNENSMYGDTEVRHALADLRYIVESNAYNAFTRSGTLTLTGNRKIKRGTFIRVNLDGVDEIFYVEGVSHNFSHSIGSIDRTTTLQLSHGMVKRYMFDNISVRNFVRKTNEEETEGGEIGSYFNIINFGEMTNLQKYKQMNMDNWRDVISTWKVNLSVFKFFLRKYQFLV